MSNSLLTDPLLRDVPEVEGFKVLDPCILSEKLGQGGMGAVYRGKHVNLDMEVAVKVLISNLAERGEEHVKRFQREAQLTAKLTHQNLVRVFDVRREHGLHYLVLEYVEGENLSDRVRRRGPVGVDEARAIITGAARGLAAAHAKGVVHRDIKPENIMISAEGEVKLMDLGLAKARDDRTPGENVTLSKAIIGTPRYMPPEQWQSFRNVLPSGDVWALGATLYFLLTGENAYEGETTWEIMQQIREEPFPDIQQMVPDISSEFAQIMTRATQPRPEERYADAGDLVKSLEALGPTPELSGVVPDALDVTKVQPSNVTPSQAAITRAQEWLETKGREELSTVAPPEGASRRRLWVGGVAGVLLVGAILGAYWEGEFWSPSENVTRPIQLEFRTLGDQDVFQLDDAVRLRIRPDQKCYLTLVGRDPDGVAVLFPNLWYASAEISANVTLEYPPLDLPDKRDGFFTNRLGVAEIWAIATRRPLQLITPLNANEPLNMLTAEMQTAVLVGESEPRARMTLQELIESDDPSLGTVASLRYTTKAKVP